MKNRIFISSTCFDLIDLRAEIKEFLLSVGLTSIMSDQLDCEFETFTDTNSIETCLINLRSCETVIFFMSQRYGGDLSNYGFGDYSATHLEYLEAVKEGKRIMFFVRDRLEADFKHFQKTGDQKGLLWIGPKDIKIFDILADRRKLSNGDLDNWIWTFRNITDVKDRLRFELKTEIKSNRLDKMIETGLIPAITVSTVARSIPNSTDILLDFTVDNVGNQTAIEPLFILFRAKDYQEVLSDGHHFKVGYYSLKSLKPLRVSDSQILDPIQVTISQEEYNANVSNFVVEVMYKTIHGDLIADATEIDIRLLLYPNIDVISRFTAKRYVSENVYEKIIEIKN